MENFRVEFAEFLDRMAEGRGTDREWDVLVVTHYHDETLEDIRRRAVRIAVGPSDTKPDDYRALAAELRSLN